MNELVLFESQDGAVTVSVQMDRDAVWLNRAQIAELFGRDAKTIGSISPMRSRRNNHLSQNLRQLHLMAKTIMNCMGERNCVLDSLSLFFENRFTAAQILFPPSGLRPAPPGGN